LQGELLLIITSCMNISISTFFRLARKNNVTLDIFFASFQVYKTLREITTRAFHPIPNLLPRQTNLLTNMPLDTNYPGSYKYIILWINSNLCHHCCNVMVLYRCSKSWLMVSGPLSVEEVGLQRALWDSPPWHGLRMDLSSVWGGSSLISNTDRGIYYVCHCRLTHLASCWCNQSYHTGPNGAYHWSSWNRDRSSWHLLLGDISAISRDIPCFWTYYRFLGFSRD
jgi:hypothetical protein